VHTQGIAPQGAITPPAGGAFLASGTKHSHADFQGMVRDAVGGTTASGTPATSAAAATAAASATAADAAATAGQALTSATPDSTTPVAGAPNVTAADVAVPAASATPADAAMLAMSSLANAATPDASMLSTVVADPAAPDGTPAAATADAAMTQLSSAAGTASSLFAAFRLAMARSGATGARSGRKAAGGAGPSDAAADGASAADPSERHRRGEAQTTVVAPDALMMNEAATAAVPGTMDPSANTAGGPQQTGGGTPGASVAAMAGDLGAASAAGALDAMSVTGTPVPAQKITEAMPPLVPETMTANAAQDAVRLAAPGPGQTLSAPEPAVADQPAPNAAAQVPSTSGGAAIPSAAQVDAAQGATPAPLATALRKVAIDAATPGPTAAPSVEMANPKSPSALAAASGPTAAPSAAVGDAGPLSALAAARPPSTESSTTLPIPADFSPNSDAKGGTKDNAKAAVAGGAQDRGAVQIAASPSAGSFARAMQPSDLLAQPLGQAASALSTPPPPVGSPVSLSGDPAQVVDRMVQSVRLQWAQGIGQAQVQLTPEYLGGLTVSLKVQADSVSASVSASTPAVREWLVANEGLLRQGLSAQGLRLDRLDIVEAKQEAPNRQSASDGRHSAPDQRPPRRGKPSGTEPAFEVLV
jgi:flagellar hook-length control protein FliK